MKIPATFADVFSIASAVAEEATVTMKEGVLVLRAWDSPHCSLIEIRFTPPPGTPIEDFMHTSVHGIKTAFLAKALSSNMDVFLEENELVAVPTDLSNGRAKQKYVTPPDTEFPLLEELKTKYSNGGVSGFMHVGAIAVIEKFGIKLLARTEPIKLRVNGNQQIEASYVTEDTGFEWSGPIGYVNEEEHPVSVCVSWNFLEPLKSFKKENISVRLKSNMPLWFEQTKTTEDGDARLTYFVAPRIEAEQPAPPEGPIVPEVTPTVEAEKAAAQEGGEKEEEEEEEEEETEEAGEHAPEAQPIAAE